MFGRPTKLTVQARIALALTECDMLAERRYNDKPNDLDIAAAAFNWSTSTSEYINFKSRLKLVFA